MDAIIDSFEEQVDTILKEIRDGFATIFKGDIPNEIVAFLDEGLTIDYDDEKRVLFLVPFLVQIDKLSERLGLEGKEPATMIDGPEKVLAMLISVLRCVIGQLITVTEPSTSNGAGAKTLLTALAEVKKEITSDDENGDAPEVNESDILGALNALASGHATRTAPTYIPGTGGRRRPVTSNDAALLGPAIVHHRPLVQKGRTLSKYLDFSQAQREEEEVELAIECCPYCLMNTLKTTGIVPRSGLYTRHIKEVHKDKWNSYAKIKCAAKECDYRAINVHSMKCHCYAMHTQQYDLWIEDGRFNFPSDSHCPFCPGKEAYQLHDLGQYKRHVDEVHLEEIYKYASPLGCSCKKSFGGTCELFTHWTKDQCDGAPLLLQALPLAPRIYAPPPKRSRTAK